MNGEYGLLGQTFTLGVFPTRILTRNNTVKKNRRITAIMNIKLHDFVKNSKKTENFNAIIANAKPPVIFLGFCITLMY